MSIIIAVQNIALVDIEAYIGDSELITVKLDLAFPSSSTA